MLKRGLAVLTASTSVLAGMALAAPAAGAQEQCPAVVVVAARGSGQNGGYEWTPTQYGASRWVSNGREGSTLRSFLHHTESVYQRDTGQSLFANVQVIGVDERASPANMPQNDFRQSTNAAEAMNEFTVRATKGPGIHAVNVHWSRRRRSHGS